MEEWVWMRHPDHGGVARVTSASFEDAWSTLGWELTTEPQPEPEAEEAEEPTGEE
jgi:hypothetical protein